MQCSSSIVVCVCVCGCGGLCCMRRCGSRTYTQEHSSTFKHHVNRHLPFAHHVILIKRHAADTRLFCYKNSDSLTIVYPIQLPPFPSPPPYFILNPPSLFPLPPPLSSLSFSPSLPLTLSLPPYLSLSLSVIDLKPQRHLQPSCTRWTAVTR